MLAEMAAKFKRHKWKYSRSYYSSSGPSCEFRCSRCNSEFTVDRHLVGPDGVAPRWAYLNAGIRANCNEMIVASIMAE